MQAKCTYYSRRSNPGDKKIFLVMQLKLKIFIKIKHLCLLSLFRLCNTKSC